MNLQELEELDDKLTRWHYLFGIAIMSVQLAVFIVKQKTSKKLK